MEDHLQGITFSSKKRLLILYGSQTGKACTLSQVIFYYCKMIFKTSQVDVQLYTFDDHGTKFDLDQASVAILLSPTVGDGEPPDNAAHFWSLLTRDTLAADFLLGLQYCLFALGDSRYEKFAIWGKQLDDRLKFLGAKSLHPTGFGDDAIGIEETFSPWLDEVLVKVAKALCDDESLADPFILRFKMYDELAGIGGLNTNAWLTVVKYSMPVALRGDSLKFEFFNTAISQEIERLTFQRHKLQDSYLSKVKLLNVKCLAGDKAETMNPRSLEKIFLEATFQGSEGMFDWSPGDAFGFMIGNPDPEVNSILKCLNLDGFPDSMIEITTSTHTYLPQICSLRHLFKYYLDIRAIPGKSFLRLLADHCYNQDQKVHLYKLCSREGTQLYKENILDPKTSIVSILVDHDASKPPLDAFISGIPGMVPRFYSAIDLMNDDRKFRIAFDVHRNPVRLDNSSQTYKPFDSRNFGAFTGTMYGLWRRQEMEKNFSIEKSSVELMVFRKRNNRFRLPEEISTPIILVSMGTGLTPFLSFLEKRKRCLANAPKGTKFGPIWLFQASSKPEHLIYRCQIETYQQEGVIDELKLCYSKHADQSLRMDILKAIQLNSESLFDLITKENGHIYVCGERRTFSKYVFAAFAQALGVHLGDEVKGFEYMRHIDGTRYLLDIWT